MRVALLLAIFMLAGCSDGLATRDYLPTNAELPNGWARATGDGMELLTEGWTRENPGKVTLEGDDWPFDDVPEPAEIWVAAWAGSDADGAEDGRFIVAYAMKFSDKAGAQALLDTVDICDLLLVLHDGSMLVGVSGGDLSNEQDVDTEIKAVADAVAQRTGAKTVC